VSDGIAPSALPSRLLINGEWLQRSSGGEYAHVNPASGAERQTVWMAGGVLEFVSVKNVVIDLA
jgi:hypothetical protein